MLKFSPPETVSRATGVVCYKIDKVLNVPVPDFMRWPQKTPKKKKKMEVKCYREVSDTLARQLEPRREAPFPVAVKGSRSGL